MGRIRTIKPELLEDERTASLSHLEWRLFVSCLLLADDYGNLRAAPNRIAGAALWCHEDDVRPALDRLFEVGLLAAYVVDGQRYAHIKGWDKHQRVDRPGKPTCPAFTDACAPRETLASDSRDTREAHATDLDLDLDREKEKDQDPPREIPAGPVSRSTLWPAAEWHRRYGNAWIGKYGGLAMGGGVGAAKAIADLHDQLAALPDGDRIASQARAEVMFREFLERADPKIVGARHPWSWFVANFSGLRVPAVQTAEDKASESFLARDERERREERERTRRDLEAEARATNAALARTRVDPSKLPTAAELAALRPARSAG